MDSVRWSDRELSRLMVGTVQFGLPYGVANRTGQPAYRDVLEMIATALTAGVNGFDTAAAYGTSEQVLGQALAELGATDQVTVVTKVMPLTPTQRATPALASAAIRESIDRSRLALRLDQLPLVLFHRTEDCQYADVLQDLQDRGRIGAWGVSGDHDPVTALRLLSDNRVAALQLPGSLLDRRHQRAGTFRQAESTGITIFVRSVYLQGLLRMPVSEIPSGLREVVPIRDRLTTIADQHAMPLGELAVRYLLSQPGVGPLVVGAETVEQLRDNLHVIERGPLDHEIVTVIDELNITLPDRVLTPSRWTEPTTTT